MKFKNAKMMIKRVGAGILTAALLAGLAGCGSGSEEQTQANATEESNNAGTSENGGKETVTVRVADMAVWNNAYFEYGEARGLLDEFFASDLYDIDFSITSFANGPAENEAFAANELDFASMGNMPSTTGAANDYGYKIVAAANASESAGAFVVLADSGITSVADLRGKRVGTIFGGGLHYFVGRLLETEGLSYDDVELINSGNETPSSIRAGELDAGAISLSAAQELIDEGTAVLLTDRVEGMVDYWGVCVSDDILQNKPELAVTLLKGYDQLTRYIDENKEDYLSYLGELTGVNTDTILETWDMVDHKVFSPNDEEIRTNGAELLQWMQAQDMIENKDLTLEDIVDYTVAEKAGY
jgi:ABC-type nitrate/sulfonate/bicarbonate transport system substrate-binding protein